MTQGSPSRSYRFVFTRARSTGSAHEHPEVQISEANLCDSDGFTVLEGATASNPGGGVVNKNQVSKAAIDGKLESKWVDGSFLSNAYHSVLELHLPKAARVVSYNLWTANDVVHRDPVDWTFEAQAENGDWVVLDERTNVQPPMDRLTAYGIAGFIIMGEEQVMRSCSSTFSSSTASSSSIHTPSASPAKPVPLPHPTLSVVRPASVSVNEPSSVVDPIQPTSAGLQDSNVPPAVAVHTAIAGLTLACIAVLALCYLHRAWLTRKFFMLMGDESYSQVAKDDANDDDFSRLEVAVASRKKKGKKAGKSKKRTDVAQSLTPGTSCEEDGLDEVPEHEDFEEVDPPEELPVEVDKDEAAPEEDLVDVADLESASPDEHPAIQHESVRDAEEPKAPWENDVADVGMSDLGEDQEAHSDDVDQDSRSSDGDAEVDRL
jgi:hypothetical protein